MNRPHFHIPHSEGCFRRNTEESVGLESLMDGLRDRESTGMGRSRKARTGQVLASRDCSLGRIDFLTTHSSYHTLIRSD